MSVMRKILSRKTLLFAIVALALFFGLAMLDPYLRQSLFGPTVRGKPWCVWEHQIRRQFGEPHEGLKDKLFRWFGVQRTPPMSLDELFDHPEMLPVVVALLDDADPEVRFACADMIPLFACLQDRSALPALRRLQHSDTDAPHRLAAAHAIWTIDKEDQALAFIVKHSDHADPDVRYYATIHLARISAAAPELFPHIANRTRDKETRVRIQAMHGLTHFGKKGVPLLIEAMNDNECLVRYAAVTVANSIGRDARDAIPALQARLHDADVAVAEEAGNALNEIDPKQFPRGNKTKKFDRR